ncbi:MAG: NAD-dependent alcohol dehydrogenase [Chloroflexi bacterium]|nr:MAG: NAD-dependent alcohol dehydrogenase [Chloroflexota bacterium]
MWFFRSPQIVYGDDAISYLTELKGRKALLVTDENLFRLGFADKVKELLEEAGMETRIFCEVEPEPSLETVQKGAKFALEFKPDWIVGLGGGSCLDAAKAIWVLYENPEMDPRGINPFEEFRLREKARLIAIPTTSGTGAETTWAVVLTDREEGRKLALGSPLNTPDIAIVDPELVMKLPPPLTASTGMDALCHAIEGFTSIWHNDFCDGLCLQAIKLVFEYLPRAYRYGEEDREARVKMHNAAAIAGLGFINSMAALAHGLGHSLGAVFHIPHGRAVGLALPYTIEYCANGGGTRYREIARFLDIPFEDEHDAAFKLAEKVRELARQVDEPVSIAEAGVNSEKFKAALGKLVENANMDACTATSVRIPSDEEMEKLFRYAYEGRRVDF